MKMARKGTSSEKLSGILSVEEWTCRPQPFLSTDKASSPKGSTRLSSTVSAIIMSPAQVPKTGLSAANSSRGSLIPAYFICLVSVVDSPPGMINPLQSSRSCGYLTGTDSTSICCSICRCFSKSPWRARTPTGTTSRAPAGADLRGSPPCRCLSWHLSGRLRSLPAFWGRHNRLRPVQWQRLWPGGLHS